MDMDINLKKGGIYSWKDQYKEIYTIIIDFDSKERIYGYDVITRKQKHIMNNLKVRIFLDKQIQENLENHSCYFWQEPLEVVQQYIDGYLGQITDEQLKCLKNYIESH